MIQEERLFKLICDFKKKYISIYEKEITILSNGDLLSIFRGFNGRYIYLISSVGHCVRLDGHSSLSEPL